VFRAIFLNIHEVFSCALNILEGFRKTEYENTGNVAKVLLQNVRFDTSLFALCLSLAGSLYRGSDFINLLGTLPEITDRVLRASASEHRDTEQVEKEEQAFCRLFKGT
jgi:hypothetical protein